MRGGENAGHSQHRNRLVTSPSHWFLWQAAGVQSILTSGQLCYKGQVGWWNTPTANSPLAIQLLEGYRHYRRSVLVCTLCFLFDIQRDDQQLGYNPKTGTKSLLIDLVYLPGTGRQDTGFCFCEEPDWNSKCALCAALAQHLDLRVNHFGCSFQPMPFCAYSSSIWCFLLTFPKIFCSLSLLHIKFCNTWDT